LSYNTAIASVMEYVNVLRAHERIPFRSEVEPLIQLLAPFAPHIAEELWETLGHTRSVFDSGWPVSDAALAAENTIDLAVQVGGKFRGTITVSRDVTKEAALAAALAEPGIARFTTTEPKKVVFVPGRLLNIVM